ncbi:hypothetical protein K449DRAFT_216189 [Hypoxylon sp. EC38]|nr:hypothetical protein K449DRAFT_216189 [Hypoxylon sp. EC38]
MDTIPPEILLHILSDLDKPLARYASVCRAFQYLIEIKTFENIAITGTLPQIQILDSVFGDGRRRCLLRKLEFTISLPGKLKSSHKKPLKCLRDRAFTLAVSRLFTCLAKWNYTPEGLEKPPSFALHLQGSTSNVDYNAVNNHHKHMQFDWLERLPSVECVNKLRVESLHIFPSDMTIICEALPHMDNLKWVLANAPRRLRNLRDELRDSMATTLLQTDFSRLQAIEIWWGDHDPLNHYWTPENYLDAEGHDRLSMGVNRILKLPNLKILTLGGLFILSPDMFDLSGEDIPNSLEELYIDVSKVSPARN